ncbi:Uncharacterised protein [Mycobacteroides abscessus subsp. massiliense]|nr:Uncharacterised protein [Mycobacteroides abscessus subsp. massiliense]
MTKNKLQWNNNQKTIMFPKIHVRIHIQKAKIKMIKANNSLKIINTHKQNINLILKTKIMIKIHQIKSNTHLIKLKSHLQKEHNLNNHSL